MWIYNQFSSVHLEKNFDIKTSLATTRMKSFKFSTAVTSVSPQWLWSIVEVPVIWKTKYFSAKLTQLRTTIFKGPALTAGVDQTGALSVVRTARLGQETPEFIQCRMFECPCSAETLSGQERPGFIQYRMLECPCSAETLSVPLCA